MESRVGNSKPPTHSNRPDCRQGSPIVSGRGTLGFSTTASWEPEGPLITASQGTLEFPTANSRGSSTSLKSYSRPLLQLSFSTFSNSMQQSKITNKMSYQNIDALLVRFIVVHEMLLIVHDLLLIIFSIKLFPSHQFFDIIIHYKEKSRRTELKLTETRIRYSL